MKSEMLKKLVCILNPNKEYVVHIKTLKQALNYGLASQKLDRFENKAKQCNDTNIELKKAKKRTLKNFFASC